MASYSEDIKKLLAPFPNGTVIETQGGRRYIPVQVYQKRLEETLGEHWHWRIVDFPQIDYERKTIMVKGELQLHQTERQAIGFSNFKALEPSQIKNAIASAEADAFRNCCDYFQMGWVDLAPYREWANNPGINLNSQKKNTFNNVQEHNQKNMSISTEGCLICKKPLSSEDKIFLEIHQIQLLYCIEHVPKHFIKNKGGQ